MKTIKRFIPRCIILFLLLLSGCGRKQKNIFVFAEKKTIHRVDKFDLGFIKGIQVKKTDQGSLITWNSLESEKSEYKKDFIGYNIYRLVRSSLVPKKSLNKKPIIQTSYLDKEVLLLSSDLKQKSYCYVLRPVFLIEEIIYLGVISQVACTGQREF